VTVLVTPVDGKHPIRVAGSGTEAATMIVEDGLTIVDIVGEALLNVRGSQLLVPPLLLLSPE